MTICQVTSFIRSGDTMVKYGDLCHSSLIMQNLKQSIFSANADALLSLPRTVGIEINWYQTVIVFKTRPKVTKLYLGCISYLVPNIIATYCILRCMGAINAYQM